MYYTYIYLDPRKPGKFCYNNFCFLYEPFYVGKGKNNRLQIINYGRNKYFKNKINKIKRSRLEPIIFKLHENLNKEKSIELEMKLISEIGRFNVCSGSLVNMTNGGEGICDYKHTEETKYRISKSEKGKIISNQTKNKISNIKKGSKQSKECKNKISDSMLGKRFVRKITDEMIIKIKLLLIENKLSQQKIADIFNISREMVSHIKNNRIWSNIRLENI